MKVLFLGIFSSWYVLTELCLYMSASSGRLQCWIKTSVDGFGWFQMHCLSVTMYGVFWSCVWWVNSPYTQSGWLTMHGYSINKKTMECSWEIYRDKIYQVYDEHPRADRNTQPTLCTPNYHQMMSFQEFHIIYTFSLGVNLLLGVNQGLRVTPKRWSTPLLCMFFLLFFALSFLFFSFFHLWREKTEKLVLMLKQMILTSKRRV